MKSYKQSSILLRNSKELNLSFLILDTQKEEDFLYYFYKCNNKSEQFKNLKGMILASSGVSNSIFYDDPRIITFSLDGKLYKCKSGNNFNQYIFAAILPFCVPDNIIFFIYGEFIKFCLMFFGKFNESQNFFNILDKVCEFLFYACLNYIIPINNMDIIGTPISIVPLMNITFSYNEITPTYIIKPGISDSLRTSIIEQMNTMNSDRTVLQETLTLMDQPYYLIGFALFFRGFVLFNSLSSKEILNPVRLSIIHEMYLRTESSSEVLVCEFIFDEYHKKMLTTILGQREFVMVFALEILGKNNCTFDPFYHLRAQDLLVNLLKKNFSSIVSEELYRNSIKLENADFMTGMNTQVSNNKENNNKKNLETKNNEILESIMSINKDIDTTMNDKSINNKESYQNNLTVGNIEVNKKQNIDTKHKKTEPDHDFNLTEINSRIKGYIDGQTNINIIHFSCYDDAENIINTTDLNLSKKLYEDIYNFIFVSYAKIQTNLNKIKKRNQKNKTSKLFNFNENNKSLQIQRKDLSTKSKENRKEFINCLNKNIAKQKIVKLTEFGINLNNASNIPVWICCKLYEHISIEDELNMDSFSNYKVIFVSYESSIPVDIDSFCQDLIMNELFI